MVKCIVNVAFWRTLTVQTCLNSQPYFQEGDILQMLADEGVRDGVTGQPEQSVDGFKFYSHHAEQIQKCQAVINS